MDFWYEFASPYSYLAAMRIERLLAPTPLRPVWRPLLLGPILKRRSGNSSAFQQADPPEARYRRRDVERLCEDAGLPLLWPSVYPRGSLAAARIAVVAAAEGWAGPFSRAVFTASFAEDRDIGSPQVLADILAGLGRDPGLLARAADPEVKQALADQVEAAIGLGIFGAPSFTVGGELFWGNDWLEQAIAWGVRHAGVR